MFWKNLAKWPIITFRKNRHKTFLYKIRLFFEKFGRKEATVEDTVVTVSVMKVLISKGNNISA